jgi:Cu-processing system permease protein
MVVPLVTTMFGVITWHASREFNELLLTQPVARRTLFTGLYLGLILPLAIAFVLGISLPFVIHGMLTAEALPLFLTLVGAGVGLTFVFGGIAVLIGVLVDDRLKAVGIALVCWLLLTVAYDGLVLLVATTFADYPLERPMLVLTLLNPVDLARALIVLRSDHAALLGYTGAVIARFLGSSTGTIAATVGMAFWILIPAWAGRRAFERRDF